MKILTAEQFIKEPYGTVYTTFILNDFGGLCVKDSARGEPFGRSWMVTDVLPWLKNDEDYFGYVLVDGKWQEYIKINSKIETETVCTDDATYNYDDDVLFAVFDKDEIEDMIKVLKEALEKLTNDIKREDAEND